MHVSLPFTPVAASLTGYATNVTAGAWTLSATTAGDSLGHTTTIQNNSVTDHSGKTATITGTDPDGFAQTETLALPGVSATVTGLKYFRTITSVVPSATIGADTMNIGWTAVAYSQCIPMNWQRQDFMVGIAVVITGTISVTVQHTFDYLSTLGNAQAATWFDHATLAAKTANADSNYAFPCIAVHLKINSVTNGATVALKVVQGAGQ